MTRSPYGSDPYGPDAYRRSLGPSARLREGRLHLRLPGRPRPVPLRRRVRRDAAHAGVARPGRRRREHRHLRHDRRGSSRTIRSTTGASACGASPTAASTPPPGCPRAPGAQGGVAAGADRRPVPGRRLVPQRRLHAGGELQLLHRLLPAPGRPVGEGRQPALHLRHPGRLRLLSRSRRAARGERAPLPAGQHLLGGQPRASDLRRVLEDARDRAAPARRHAGGADGRRLVRRRGSGRAAAHLSRHRTTRARPRRTVW